MIHVLGLAERALASPGRACALCGGLCGAVGCGALKRCCEAAGRLYARLERRPLSSFVALSASLGAAELGCCLRALGEPALREGCAPDAGRVGPLSWLRAQTAFAVLPLVFAPYLQARVWARLLAENVDTTSALPATAEFPLAKSRESCQHVFLYDFGVLFYCLGALLSVFWSHLGSDLLTRAPGCGPSGDLVWACRLGACQFWVV